MDSEYKEFFEEAPVALIRSDLKSGDLIMANKHAATLLGFGTVDELLAGKATDFYPMDVRKHLIKKLRKDGVLENEEVELHLRDGRRIWIRANFRLNCNGTCIECYMVDITNMVQLREKQLNDMNSLAKKIDLRIAAFAPLVVPFHGIAPAIG